MFVMETFEKDCQCVTAQYDPITATSFSIHNYCTLGSPNGTANMIDGRGWQPHSSDPGKMMVQFSSGGLPFPAPYWVLALGPTMDHSSKYCWAIVSDPLSLFLYVLVRNVDAYENYYKATIMALVKKLGFVGLRAPIDTYQGSDCKYEWVVEK
jgi:lipocalin